MYVLIDHEDLKVICKNRNWELVKAEAARFEHPVIVDITTGKGLEAFTDYELRVLYRTIGSVGTTVVGRVATLEAVQKIMKYLPETRLPLDPSQPGVFTVEVPDEAAETRPQRAPTGRDRPAANTVAPTRMSGVRSVIWEHADKAWEAAGKPTDKAEVLKLRKQMMTDLEGKGVKRTSSSNELGNWQKARIPG